MFVRQWEDANGVLIKNALESTFSLEHSYAITSVNGSNCVVSLMLGNRISGHVTLEQDNAREPWS